VTDAPHPDRALDHRTTPHDDDSARLEQHLRQQSKAQFQRQMQEATALLSAGKGREAIPLLERCQKLYPDDVNLLINLGGAYILAGRHCLAIPPLEQASQIEPENPAIWSNLAAAHLGKLVTATREQQAKALADYRRVIEIDYAYPNVHYNMGLIHIDRREWDKAFDAFTRAIETDPHDADARVMRNRVDEIRRNPPPTPLDGRVN
jgi:tetratricopeptide (TPR) repeat protein